MIRESFNSDWYFYKENDLGKKQVIGPLTLPHDAMLLEERNSLTKNGYNTGYFPGGIYHYQKTFFVPNAYRDKNVILEFEAVYMNSEVYLNGELAGGRPYGYSNFYIAADRFLKYGQDNQIEVVAHNESEPNSRWYSGSGIYRNVNIFVANRLHIPPNGVKITTMEIKDQQALLDVAIKVVNNENFTREIRIGVEFQNEAGEIAVSGEIVGSVEADAIRRSLCTILIYGLWINRTCTPVSREFIRLMKSLMKIRKHLGYVCLPWMRKTASVLTVK